MKSPVHSIKKVDGHVLVLRIKEPRFFAIYNEESKTLDNLEFENGIPPNEDSILKKAIAAVNQFLSQKHETS